MESSTGRFLAPSFQLSFGGGVEAPAQGFFGGPFRDFENIGGVHLSASVLWCDANRRSGLNFLSSANAGELGKNRRFLCTEATQVLASRGRGKLDVLTAPFDQPLTIGDLTLSLHPAGHMLGAAQIAVQREERVVVYAGEVNPRPSATAGAAEPRACDVLALPATYATRGLRFPAREEVLRDIRRFIDSTLGARATPVLLAPPLDIAQELLVELGRGGYKLKAHRQIADIAKLYGQLGVSLPPFRRLGKTIARGDVVLMPLILRAQAEVGNDPRLALVGPRALDPVHVHQQRVAKAFPLSNVADGAALKDFVLATGAQEVFLTGGAVADFRASLQDEGLRIHDLLPREQLELF